MAKNTARPDVASQPRQSHVAFADYVNTLAQHAPDQLDGLVDPSTVDAALAAIETAGENFTSTTDKRIEKVIADKVGQAVAALSKEDELTGYVGFEFDTEAFAKRVAPKTGRRRLSAEDRANRVVEQASEEQLEALAELLKARGLA